MLAWLGSFIWKEPSLEIHDFIDICKDKHLTLEDIKELETGKELDLVVWDRNFEEYKIWKELQPEKVYDPETFFSENRCKCIYKGDLKWDIVFGFGQTIQHPLHLNIDDYWLPIDNGYVNVPNGPKVLWYAFPDTTRIGWRGPVMLWNQLAKMPKVYYKN